MNISRRAIIIFKKKLRKKGKQTYYQSILKDYQNDMTRRW